MSKLEHLNFEPKRYFDHGASDVRISRVIDPKDLADDLHQAAFLEQQEASE